MLLYADWTLSRINSLTHSHLQCSFYCIKDGGGIHRRIVTQKTKSFALTYSQSRICLVFCPTLGFPNTWFFSPQFGGFSTSFLCLPLHIKHEPSVGHFRGIITPDWLGKCAQKFQRLFVSISQTCILKLAILQHLDGGMVELYSLPIPK